ncbi:hypothetical protein NMG60_11035300 [Bertholletia excelsa]
MANPSAGEDKEKRPRFCINDNVDVLVEVLKRLDGRSLGAAAGVCRLWRSIARSEWLWEQLCFRHVAPPPGVRPVVAALGGYRRLYMVCLRPVLTRLSKRKRLDGTTIGGGDAEVVRRVWTRHEVEVSLSLFCIDYYERLDAGAGGGRMGETPAAASLMFLCKPVNV